MKVLVQWSLAVPADWEQVDSSGWSALPKKPEPTAGDTVDSVKGWLHAVNIQGVVFDGDHHHLESLLGGVRLRVWNDDPVDWPPGRRHARVWDLLFNQPDRTLGGAINTKQSQVIYAEDEIMAEFRRVSLDKTTFQPWSDFMPPPEAETRHGIEVLAALNRSHVAVRSTRGWREWTEGLLPIELDADGNIRQQRKQARFIRPDGTRTYFAHDTNLTNGIHVATNEDAFELGTAGAGSESVSLAAGTDVLGWSFVTPAGEPDSNAWPTGDYRFQLDVTVNAGTNQLGLLTLGGSAGHFARVNSGITSDLETKAQAEAAFTGTGLKLATTGSVPWSSGAASDRFECLVAVENPAAHGGSKTTTLQLNESDDFADGPWTAPPAPPGFNLFDFGGV